MYGREFEGDTSSERPMSPVLSRRDHREVADIGALSVEYTVVKGLDNNSLPCPLNNVLLVILSRLVILNIVCGQFRLLLRLEIYVDGVAELETERVSG